MNLTGQPIYQKADNERFSASTRQYNRWIHSYQTCCLTGRPDIDNAHTGSHREGKGMARKANPKTILPLSLPLHMEEERNRPLFWQSAGLGGLIDGRAEYLIWAERLHDLWEKRESPMALFADMQSRANREYLASILSRFY